MGDCGSGLVIYNDELDGLGWVAIIELSLRRTLLLHQVYSAKN